MSLRGPAGDRPPERAPPVARDAGSPARGGLSDLGVRALSAIVLMALALASDWAGGAFFALFWWTASVLVLWEWVGIARVRAPVALLFLYAAVLLGAAVLSVNGSADWAIALAVAGALALAPLVAAGGRFWGVGGCLYAAALVISTCFLRGGLLGEVAILWLFIIVWTTDVMAYFGGRLIGGPKLAPRISPKKTISGFVVGVSCAALAGLAVIPAESRAWPAFAMGLAAAVISQGGDLFESWVKRRFGVKDSGRLIPGHGGAMDRLDGFIAAAAFLAAVAALRGGMSSPALGALIW